MKELGDVMHILGCEAKKRYRYIISHSVSVFQESSEEMRRIITEAM